jgi:hypothetical protein
MCAVPLPPGVNLIAFIKYINMYKIEKNEMGGACSTYGARRGAYRVLEGKPDGKSPLGRPRSG